MKRYVLSLAAALLCSCNSEKEQSKTGTEGSTSCRGIYYSRNAYGDLQKFNEFRQADRCLTDQIALSTYEASTERRRKHGATCKPQPSFPSMALKASGNFYSYRDDRLYLEFNSQTGVFRRLTLGEDQNGKPVYQRDLSCFYARDDHEVEPVDAQDYGKQILLDFSNYPASSADFVPNEIFSYTDDGTGNWFFTRYDDSTDWDGTFCPERTTPFTWCKELRNGNLYFYPALSAAIQATLTLEAKLIRSQFNYSAITKAEFETLWNTLDKNGTESQQGGDWRYRTNHVVDAPKLFDYDWRLYLMGQRQTMPAIRQAGLPPVCYQGSRYVNLAGGGTGKIFGEICFANGTYSFTPN